MISILKNYSVGATAVTATAAMAFGLSSPALMNQEEFMTQVVSTGKDSFTLFQNSQPTTQTHIIREFTQEWFETSFKRDLAWVDNEIENFMDALISGDMPNYSDDLLALADLVLQENPDAVKNL